MDQHLEVPEGNTGEVDGRGREQPCPESLSAPVKVPFCFTLELPHVCAKSVPGLPTEKVSKGSVR